MLEERIVELIQRDIDREIDEPERVELRARLERDPDARLFHHQMRNVAEFLEAAPADDPPADFTESVMMSVRVSGSPAEHADAPAAAVIPFPRRFGALSLGLGLAAAVLIAFFAAPSLFRALDSSHIGGTMLEPPAVVETHSWTTAAGAVRITERGATLLVTVNAPPESTRVAELSYDARVMHIESIHDAIGTQSAPGRVEVSVRGSAAVVAFRRMTREPVSFTVKVHGQGMDEFNGRIEIPESANF